MRLLRAFLIFTLAGLALAPSASADDFVLETADDDAWNEHWPRARWWEVAGSAALMAEAFTVRFGLEWNEEPTWRGGILFDGWVRDNVSVTDDTGAYRAWLAAGDWAYRSSLVWPVLDPLTVAAVTGDWDAPVQMLAMNLEAYSFFAATLWTTQYFVRRERPTSAELCESDPQRAEELEITCGSADRNRSFLGGHTGVAVLNAALTCMHHTQMDLYGDVGDGLVCGAWIAAAGVTFASRTLTGKHYLTDNIFGTGLGLLSGIAIPYLLHYGQEQVLIDDIDVPDEKVEGPQIVGFTLQPDLGRRGLSLQMHGLL